MNKAHNLLVVDSGVGGLSIAREIRNFLPDAGITYVADNAAFPYGLKSPQVIIDRVSGLLERFDVENYDAAVIACNTASTVVMETLRKKFKTPFVGVVPPVKPAGLITKTGRIGILATETTARGSYLNNLIKQYIPKCSVVRITCPELAEMAEDVVRSRPIDMSRLFLILSPLFDSSGPRIDTVVLGCTHYPLLNDYLMAIAPEGVQWIDPAVPVARHLKHVLKDKIPKVTHKVSSENTISFTAPQDHPEELRMYLAGLGFIHIMTDDFVHTASA